MKIKGLTLAMVVLCVFAISHVNAQTEKPDKEKQFKEMDLNSDGFLSKEEFSKGMEGKKSRNGQEIDADRIFTRKDTNSDSKIDLNEFLARPEKSQRAH